MKQGQRESIYLIYMNICNALIYSEDLAVDTTLSYPARNAIRIVRDRLRWIKREMDMKTKQDLSKTVDTLRYDSILRLLANLPENYQDKFEDMVVQFLKDIEKEIL